MTLFHMCYKKVVKCEKILIPPVDIDKYTDGSTG